MRAAGIVLYNPNLNRLKNNLDAIVLQVDYIYCVDNGSQNIADIEEFLDDYTCISLKKNNVNKGIATALNQLVSMADLYGAEWILTLDQDSIVRPGLVDEYEKVLPKLSNVGMLTCVIEDRNTHQRTGNESEDIGYESVDICITSGSYLNVTACKNAGGFDEKMFIDFVDFDMCQLLHETGYNIYRINYYGLYHELGELKKVSFLGKKLVFNTHSSFREYYITRNHLYYARKHQMYLDKWREYKRVVIHVCLVILFDDNKFQKIKAMIRGTIDSRKMLS